MTKEEKMRGIDLAKKLIENFFDIERTGLASLSQDMPAAKFFHIDGWDTEYGNYFYVYLQSEREVERAEKFLGRPFSYAFPLRGSSEWVGLVALED